jgi:hypothetical protein
VPMKLAGRRAKACSSRALGVSLAARPWVCCAVSAVAVNSGTDAEEAGCMITCCTWGRGRGAWQWRWLAQELQIQRDDGGIFATLTVGQVWHFTRSLLGRPALYLGVASCVLGTTAAPAFALLFPPC